MTQTETTTQKDQPLELVAPSDQPITCSVVIDCGNARTVALVLLGEQVHEIVLPSVRSLSGVFSYQLFRARGLPRDSWGNLAADEHVLELSGVERYLGRLAVEHARAASTGRGSDVRYSDGTVLDFVLATVAAALPMARKISIAQLVTIVPIGLWDLIAADVERSLHGLFSYRYNGRELKTKIDHVQVLREGETAYAALSTAPQGRALILDGGGRTHNIGLFSDGVYRLGATLELGVDAALDDVDAELVGQGVPALTLGQRLQLLDALLLEQPYTITHKGRAVAVAPIARRRFDAAARAVVGELYAKVPRVASADHISYVGGAAYPQFFGSCVQKLLADQQIAITLEPEPELKNAYGALAWLGAQPRKIKKASRRK